MNRMLAAVLLGFLMMAGVRAFGEGTAKPKEQLSGTWAGALKEGDVSGYLQMVFQEKDGTFSGSYDVPTARKFRVPFTAIQLNDSAVHAEAEGIVLDAKISDRTMTGTMKIQGQQFPYQAVQLATVPWATLEKYVGIYQIDDAHYLYLQPWQELGEAQLTYLDDSGRIGLIYPESETNFIVGPSILVPVPVQARVALEVNGRSLTWKDEASGKVQTAKRVEVYKKENVSFKNGDIPLAGLLMIPSTPGPHPALVLLHGSGPQDRYSMLPFVHFLTRSGFAVLGYDKRGVGESGGDWRAASFDDLAGDAVAAIEYLKTRKEINAKQIGVIGVSQGGWIGPLVASKSPADTAFVISVSGPGVPPAEQELDRVEHELRAAGVPESEISEALALQRLRDDCVRGKASWEALKAEMDKSRNRDWFDAMGLPEGPDNPFVRFWKPLVDFDPLRILSQVHCPVLAVFGAVDQNVLADKNSKLWTAALEKAGNKKAVVLTLSGANHIMIEAKTGSLPEFPTLKRFVPQYRQLLTAWLLKTTTTEPQK